MIQLAPPDVLLAHSYYLAHDEKQFRKMKPYAPLATLMAGAVLREAGVSVTLFDAMLAGGVEDYIAVLDATQPEIVAIVEDSFNFLTKMCTVRMRDAALEMIRAAKARGCRVVVNGADASDQVPTYLDAGADAVIIGEVEMTLLELVSVWRADQHAPIDGIAGLALPAEGSVLRTNVRPRVDALDTLPFPAWDLVDAGRYREAWHKAHGRLSWSVTASRGCPFKCNWCAKPVFGSRYTQRGAASVAEELRLLKKDVAPGHIWFTDDIFGLTAAWIHEFADEVVCREARIPFLMQQRVNLMKDNVVFDLARAGAEEVWLGVESGSQRILDAMDKHTSIAQIRSATQTLRAHGIRSGWFIQLGYLGEDWMDIVMTRDLIREEMPDDIGVSISYPLPGTRFYDIVKHHLGTKRNWSDSDDLAMMFRGTYVTTFYKELRELLHDEARTWKDASPEMKAILDARWAAMTEKEATFRVDNLQMAPL